MLADLVSMLGCRVGVTFFFILFEVRSLPFILFEGENALREFIIASYEPQVGTTLT